MSKLSEIMNKLKEKWKSMTKTRKIALTIISIVAVLAIGILLYVSLTPKYTVLFSELDTNDSGNIMASLDEKGASYKIQGNSILVKESEVDKLRMEVLSKVNLTEGSKGFELFDSAKVGATDDESRVMYQRALSGEIERTIKAFDEVDSAKVNLVIPNDSAFVTTKTPASASVTVKLVPGASLSDQQVKSIVYLVCGSVENLNKKDVTIVSDNLNLLTEGLFDEEEGVQSANTDKQIAATKKVEEEFEKKILNVLEPIYRDNVKVSVNAILNFDAIKQNNVTYDKENNVLASEHNIIDKKGQTNEDTSSSPVDNNMSNTQDSDNEKIENGGYYEETKNYENSKTEEVVVKAQGQVDRITTSVVINGAINEETRQAITGLVEDAIGYNQERGDGISVEGMAFDSTYKDQAQAEIDAMKEAEAKAARRKLIALGAAAVAAIVLVIVIITTIKKKNKNDDDEDDIDDEITADLDITVGEDDMQTKMDAYRALNLNLDVETDKERVIKEVQKYAEKKPEQVAEVIKSWLTEEERR